MQLKSVSIIGSGNVATQVGVALSASGITIQSVYSRNAEHGQQLANVLKTTFVDHIASLPLDSDVYLIAVSDKAIAEVAEELPEVHGLVVHTAGMVPMSLVEKYPHCGVFYPLQSLTKSIQPDFANVPFLIEAKQSDDLAVLRKMGENIGSPVYEVTSEQRRFYHLAAVFANNFTNHLYHISETILQQEQLSFDVLKPMIMETARKALTQSAAINQTGPARRGDLNTVAQHLGLLDKLPQYKQIYEILSESIRNEYLPDDKKA